MARYLAKGFCALSQNLMLDLNLLQMNIPDASLPAGWLT